MCVCVCVCAQDVAWLSGSVMDCHATARSEQCKKRASRSWQY